MISEYMKVFLEHEAEVKAKLASYEELELWSDGYLKLARIIVETLAEHYPKYSTPLPELDPERIQEIDWGNYQGTLLYVIGAEGYQPSEFFTMVVDYGSCSGCDTLQSILNEKDPVPDLFTLCRNMLSSMHKVEGGLY